MTLNVSTWPPKIPLLYGQSPRPGKIYDFATLMMSWGTFENDSETAGAELTLKSGLRFSLRHRESVERVHINRGIW